MVIVTYRGRVPASGVLEHVCRETVGIHQRTKFTSALLFSFPSAYKVAKIHRDKDHRRDNNQAGGEDESKAKLINQSMVIHSTDTGERNAGRPAMSTER